MNLMPRIRSRTNIALFTRRERAFTLLELVVVIVIIGILLVVAITRLLPYLDEAERVGVLSLESQLKNSLVMEAAQRIVRGESASISELEGSNPMALLLEAPKSYVGERRSGDGGTPERSWYFDLGEHRLVYKTGTPYAFSARDDILDDPQFEVRVIFEDRDADGVFNAGKDELYGVRLLRIAGANWLSRGNRY
jgi:prepilin-type N-terminal cleavage/methylation domain-containing protein